MRPDMSDKLIHWTRGADSDACGNLLSIMQDRRVRGNNASIRSGENCVCMSEAPLAILPNGFVSPDTYSKYSPFGVMFDKTTVYDNGGRHVIYQSEHEFGALPHGLQWRHMRYEPTANPPIDFTWEREWRVRCDGFEVVPWTAVLVVPDHYWVDVLVAKHEHDQDMQELQYAQILDELIAAQYRDDFPWRVATLSTP